MAKWDDPKEKINKWGRLVSVNSPFHYLMLFFIINMILKPKFDGQEFIYL